MSLKTFLLEAWSDIWAPPETLTAKSEPDLKNMGYVLAGAFALTAVATVTIALKDSTTQSHYSKNTAPAPAPTTK